MGKIRKPTELICLLVVTFAYHAGILVAVYLEKGGINRELAAQTIKDHRENSLMGFVIALGIAWFVMRTTILHRQHFFKKFLKILLAALFVAVFTTVYYFIKITFFQEGSQWPELEVWPALLKDLSYATLRGLLYSCSAAVFTAILFSLLLRKTSNS